MMRVYNLARIIQKKNPMAVVRNHEEQIVPESNTFGLSALGQIAVTVSNLDEAVTFYRDKLGLPFLFSATRINT